MTGIDLARTVQTEKLPDQGKTFAKTDKGTDFTKLLNEKKQDTNDGSGGLNKTGKDKADSVPAAGAADSKTEPAETLPADKKEILESELLMSGLMSQLQAAIMQQDEGASGEAIEPGGLLEGLEVSQDICISDEMTSAADGTAGMMEKQLEQIEGNNGTGEKQPDLFAEAATTADAAEKTRVQIPGAEKQAEADVKPDPVTLKHEEGMNQPQDAAAQSDSKVQPHTEAKTSSRNEDKSGSGQENGTMENFAQASNIGQNTEVSSPRFEQPLESTVKMKTTPESLPQDLGKILTGDIVAKGKTVTIELEPETLGKLTIKAEYDGGRLVVSILSSNPKTLEVLSQRAGELAGIMEAKTGQETIIQTPQAEAQEQQNFERQGGGNGENARQQEREKERQQPDTFAQQLRLGLI